MFKKTSRLLEHDLAQRPIPMHITPHNMAPCLTLYTYYRLQRSGLISMYPKNICLN